ncbi:UNVERIFIED_CONTAM: hypothetical protein K2H54_062039 [Gekko kuhli]
MNDSCRLLQAITVKPDSEEEEMILGKQDSDIKRNAELLEPVLENTKRRKTLGPSLDHDDSSSVMDNPVELNNTWILSMSVEDEIMKLLLEKKQHQCFKKGESIQQDDLKRRFLFVSEK